MAALVELVIVPDVNELAKFPLDIPERPLTTGAVHVYLVLLGTMLPFNVVWSSTGVVEVDAPEQIAERAMAAIDGLGLTVIDTLNAVPEQLPDVGVTE
jgi:hypothetical protein